MKGILIIVLMNFIAITASASEGCDQEVTGRVLKVQEKKTPRFMSHTGDAIEAKEVLVSLIQSREGRAPADLIVKSFTIHQAIEENALFHFNTKNGVICSYLRI